VTGAPAAQPPTVPPGTIWVVEVAAVGDVLMHGTVKEAAAAADRKGADGRSENHDGYAALFAGVRDDLSSADLAFANLETPIAAKPPNAARPFVFNAPATLIPALRDTGIDVVSFANNHVYDQGASGFAQTLAALDAGGLPYLGAGATCEDARRARTFEAHGVTVAFLGTTRLYNDKPERKDGDPCSFDFEEGAVLREAAAARKAGADFVILSIHWGVEYVTAPRQEEIDLAHRLLEGGVDVILGHHPHVLQPVEVYEAADGRLTAVAYSLGNFISNQSRTYAYGVHADRVGNTRDGALLRFRAVKRKLPSGTIRTELADLSVDPLWTDNNALARTRDGKLAPVIRVVSTTRELAAVRAELASHPTPARTDELERRRLLLEARRKLAGAILGEDLLP
jgi:poly-gamma-glutamate synthesis protein (capsule biosynthesis protein)